jgi:hypothetical protein
MKRKILVTFCSAAAILAVAALAARAMPGKPVFTSYRGVTIGTPADEARKKLGTPKEKSDETEYFAISDNESVQVFYDAQQKVRAMSIMFMGDLISAPAPKAVFGSAVEARDDGGIYKLERHPEEGFFVSYTRTGGDEPMIVIVMQKI